jgi:DMSO reductase iron-sulfur subunit
MYEVRDNEPWYARLSDPETEEHNRYGNLIDLVQRSGLPANDSMQINGDTGVGSNPNRNKQHGFHFTADNCIACHACEAACSEKNNLPPHLAFRSVGYVEGGTYPSFARVNISMACNHCDDPVCLKGCPTRAYTKHAEYGAVLQDPDICFGCGYCTWVCPYNAPQLDPVEGHVQKCNMCVDRLEVGLKPACVSACLGNALDFGVIENTPQRREQTQTHIPGFPDPDITHPNIRFELQRSLPNTVTRTDSQPIKYTRKGTDGRYVPELDEQRAPTERGWNLARLSSRENPLVAFTLVSQAVIGAFTLLCAGRLLGVESFAARATSPTYPVFLLVLLGLMALVLFFSTLHLGKPLRFYRGFNNLRHSPLSREAAGISGFFAALGAHWLTVMLGPMVLDWIPFWLAAGAGALFAGMAVLAGCTGLYFMTRIYRIKARPFWDHWQVASAFYGTALALGGVLLGLGWPSRMLTGTGGQSGVALVIAAGLAIEAVGLVCHARAMLAFGREGAVAYNEQITTYGYTYWTRNLLLGGAIAGAVVLALAAPAGVAGALGWVTLTIVMAATALVGRALFYVLVIPTTMPGAFFWRNKGFEEHAVASGLALMPQVGVVRPRH